VIPHETLFHHQLDFATHLTWNVTNVIFIFATSPNTKPKEKNVGGTYYAPRLKKWGGNVPRVPYLIAPMIVSALDSSVKLADRRECSFCNYRLLQVFNLYRNLFYFLLRLVVLKRLGFQSQKYGIPICTSINKFYAVCFWIRDNHRYSKVSYISTRTKSMLYCGLSHVQLQNYHWFKKIAFLTVYYTE